MILSILLFIIIIFVAWERTQIQNSFNQRYRRIKYSYKDTYKLSDKKCDQAMRARHERPWNIMIVDFTDLLS